MTRGMTRGMTYLAMGCAAAFALTAGGCLVTGSSNIERHGTKVSSSTLDQVVLGETSEAWLLATLGEPTECTSIEDQPSVKVYKYEYVETHRDRGSVFLILAHSSKKEKPSTTFFEVHDGVVTKYWVERSR